jgi:hypothetical protein
VVESKLPKEQEQFVLEAVRFLESPSVLIKLTDLLGRPLELAQSTLPEKVQVAVRAAVSKALSKSLDVAIQSVPPQSGGGTPDWDSVQESVRRKGFLHVAATSATGALGGFFGTAGLAMELPLTTTLMLRSISDIAASYGTDLSLMENRLECLYVFTLGSKGQHDDAMESSYFSSRIAFSRIIRGAVASVERGAAPAFARLLARVASAFEVAVTEKMLAEAVPVIGALGGAAINAGFTEFFNEAAKFHFGLKRLEAEFGEDLIRSEYERALSIIKERGAN